METSCRYRILGATCATARLSVGPRIAFSVSKHWFKWKNEQTDCPFSLVSLSLARCLSPHIPVTLTWRGNIGGSTIREPYIRLVSVCDGHFIHVRITISSGINCVSKFCVRNSNAKTHTHTRSERDSFSENVWCDFYLLFHIHIAQRNGCHANSADIFNLIEPIDKTCRTHIHRSGSRWTVHCR